MNHLFGLLDPWCFGWLLFQGIIFLVLHRNLLCMFDMTAIQNIFCVADFLHRSVQNFIWNIYPSAEIANQIWGGKLFPVFTYMHVIYKKKKKRVSVEIVEMKLTHWRLVPSIHRLGSMGNVRVIAKSNGLQWVKNIIVPWCFLYI